MYKVIETIRSCDRFTVHEYHAQTLTGIRGHILSIVEHLMAMGEGFTYHGFGDVPLLAKRVLDSRSRVVEVGRVH